VDKGGRNPRVLAQQARADQGQTGTDGETQQRKDDTPDTRQHFHTPHGR
jgi:hypothetical protein